MRVVPFLITVASILCLLSLAGSSSAATSASAANPAAALRGAVSIRCEGTLQPKPRDQSAYGRCVISGAIIDAGKFTDGAPLFVTPHYRTFLGRKGTLVISVYRERGNWMVIEGSRAYAGLSGRGWERVRATTVAGAPCNIRGHGIGCFVALTMNGKISR